MQHFSLYSNLTLTSESAALKTASEHIIAPHRSSVVRKIHWRTLYLLFNLSLPVFYLLQHTLHPSATCTHKHTVARACISLQLQVWNVETWFRYLMSCENNSPKMSQVIQQSDALSWLAALGFCHHQWLLTLYTGLLNYILAYRWTYHWKHRCLHLVWQRQCVFMWKLNHFPIFCFLNVHMLSSSHCSDSDHIRCINSSVYFGVMIQ